MDGAQTHENDRLMPYVRSTTPSFLSGKNITKKAFPTTKVKRLSPVPVYLKESETTILGPGGDRRRCNTHPPRMNMNYLEPPPTRVKLVTNR